MHSFRDAKGRDWTIDINVTSIRYVKARIDVDLLSIVGGDLLGRVAGDPALLCDILYVLCEDQAKAAGISDLDFGRGLAGDALEAASDAFLEDLADFFPRARRGLLKEALAKMRELETLVLQRGSERLASGKPEEAMVAILERLESQASGPTSGESPASSASTPAPSPSASSSGCSRAGAATPGTAPAP